MNHSCVYNCASLFLRQRPHQQNRFRIRHQRIPPFKVQVFCTLELGFEILQKVYSQKLLNVCHIPTTRTSPSMSALSLCRKRPFNLPNMSCNSPERPVDACVHKRSVFIQEPRRVEFRGLWIERIVVETSRLKELHSFTRGNFVAIGKSKRFYCDTMYSV